MGSNPESTRPFLQGQKAIVTPVCRIPKEFRMEEPIPKHSSEKPLKQIVDSRIWYRFDKNAFNHQTLRRGAWVEDISAAMDVK